MRETLQKIYNDLNEYEKLILQVSAYCFVPLSTHMIGKILIKTDIKIGEITKSCNALQKKGFFRTRAGKMETAHDISLIILADTLKDTAFTKYIAEITQFEKAYQWTESTYRYLRNLIVAYYQNDKYIEPVISNARYHALYFFEYLEPVLEYPESEWLFKSLETKALYAMLNKTVLDLHTDLLSLQRIINFDKKLKSIPDLVKESNSSNLMLANFELLNGNFGLAEKQLLLMPEKYHDLVLPFGILKLYRNDVASAYDIMHKSMSSKKKSEMFVNYEIYYAAYYILSLLSLDAAVYTPYAQKMLAAKDSSFNYANIIASALLHYALGDTTEAETAISRAYYFSSSVSNLDNIFLYMAVCYTESPPDIKYMDAGKTLLDLAANNGYKLLALELAYSLSLIYKTEEFENAYSNLSRELNQQAVLSRKQKHEKWELALNSLLGVVSDLPVRKSKAEKNVRIVYFVDLNKMVVQPTLQTSTTTGKWSKGRNIALKRMKELSIDGMTEQDQRIAASIKRYGSYGYWNNNGEQYEFDENVWPALAGHPYLFLLNNPEIPVILEKAQPTITVEETNNGFILKADVEPENEDFIIRKETNTHFKLINIDQRQRSMLQTINRSTLIIPKDGKDKLLQTLEEMSAYITIHSDMMEARKGTHIIEGDSRIRVQLLPMGNTIKAELFVKPFGTVPPYCKPGAGGQTIIGMVDEQRCQASRDLKKETRYANAILEEIQQNTSIDVTQDLIVFEDPRDSLYLLEVLSKHQHIAIVEWPEGARFKFGRSVSMNQVKLDVKGVDYWFEIDGKIQVDEQTVLSVKELLDLNAKSYGRFIELGNGEFISLSNDLKKRLDELQAYSQQAGNKVKVNRFASMSLSGLFEQAGLFESDDKWKAFQTSLSKAKDIQPVVPKTLKTELRPYQEDGFSWMVQLSEWGAGACLADDMGLGKTIQALALMLQRAAKGPALVICPASVVSNWVNEISRFAPSLNVVLLNNTNRQEALTKAGAFDVMATTYGLMQSEGARFAQKEWATIVLDEAHAIKNYNTKTSKAAMNLKADFRLILTGTPVQNHLSEVWNLFNFINPGLLGSVQQFNERYVKTGDAGRKRLRKLITPFILRRTKNNVLDELPPKTEIIKQVELSESERVFYEAIRRKAIENLQHTGDASGQQHLKALAEITRLRLACCNPVLVEPNVKIPSSKLAAFLEIVDELRGNNHRALVFSQFVKHLSVIREALDKEHIKYKYLDGATPLPERERNVRDFQAGEGELFLISLKAGGLGLNLTAADYVIHLDPWWNPAIEDQASDRAHRIGQKRPVTIYRLVAQQTIEEKIILLHNTKRDMADSLLEGTDTPGKLSTDELLKLIMEV